MDKKLAFKLSVFSSLDPNAKGQKTPDPIYVNSVGDLQNVLKEIFSVDEVTGFPKGDIQYYLSKDGNPMVKQWLESNLLSPRRSVSSNPAGVDDDLIVEMSRQKDESISDYQARLTSIYDSAKAEYERSLVPDPPKNE